jgi:hypothetical protein
LQSLKVKRLIEAAFQPYRDLFGVGGFAQNRHQRDELVTADPRQHVVVAQL